MDMLYFCFHINWFFLISGHVVDLTESQQCGDDG